MRSADSASLPLIFPLFPQLGCLAKSTIYNAIALDGGAAIERPAPGEGQASDQLTEWQQMIQALGQRIAGDVPIAPEDRNPEQQARWVLANILDWHRREEKAVWWEFFRLSECSVEELIDERGALAQLEFIGEAGGTGRRPIHRYRFPVQETSLRGGEELRMVGGERLGTLASIDPQTGTLAGIHPEAVFAHDLVPTYEHRKALVRIGEHVADQGMAGNGAYGAARDMLLGAPPRLGGQPIRRPGETALDAALRVARHGNFGGLAAPGSYRRGREGPAAVLRLGIAPGRPGGGGGDCAPVGRVGRPQGRAAGLHRLRPGDGLVHCQHEPILGTVGGPLWAAFRL